MAKISVLMPVLNGMPYFPVALASVCQQTLQDIEIIVIDAGSTDGTREFLQRKAGEDHRIRVLSSDQRSMGRQYNLGAEAAQGEYLAFCEADDEFVLGFLAKAYAGAEAHSFPDIVKLDFTMFMGDGDERYELRYAPLPVGKRKELLALDDCPELYLRDLNQWNGIYRSRFVRENHIRWNETPGAAFQDMGFVQQTLFLAQSILYLEDLSYNYRRDNEGSSVYQATARFLYQELRYMMKLFREHPEWKPYVPAMVERMFGSFG